MSRTGQSIGIESGLLVVRSWGEGLEGGVERNGQRLSYWDDENVLKLEYADGCTTL